MKIDSILTPESLSNYFSNLVNSFFKILPLREAEEDSLSVYAESLQLELMGCQKILGAVENDSGFVSLICILQKFIDDPQYPVAKTKREVFKAISICNRMKKKYGASANCDDAE